MDCYTVDIVTKGIEKYMDKRSILKNAISVSELNSGGAIFDYCNNGYDTEDALGLLYYIIEYYQRQTMMLISMSKYIGDMNYACRICKS